MVTQIPNIILLSFLKTDPDESYKFYKEAAYEGNIYAQNKYAYIEKERNP